jgi:NTE family protein
VNTCVKPRQTGAGWTLDWCAPTLFNNAALLSAVLLTGCAHAPLNRPIEGSGVLGYRIESHVRPKGRDDLLLVLLFSGGGTRAAALSYGVLRELKDTKINVGGQPGRLLDQVDAISAVSGGAFTAAYYCAFGDDTFSSLESRFLKHDVQQELWIRCLRPDNIGRLSSAYYGRSDLAAAYYDKALFHGKTFGDLTRIPDRPFLIINATDLSTGGRFGFTQDNFDLIGSDLSQFPISRAVAASSAVPLFLTPVTLRNFSGTHHIEEENEDPIDEVLKDSLKQVLAEIGSYTDGTDRRYIHLVDGGVADNLGLRAFQDFTMLHGGLSSSLNYMQLSHITKIAVVVVDASVRSDGEWDHSAATPGTISVLNAIAGGMLNRWNYVTTEVFRHSVELWKLQVRAQRERNAGATKLEDLDFYMVNVSFADLEHQKDRAYFNAVRTGFALRSDTVDRIENVGGSILRADPEFKRLVKALGAVPKGDI